MHHADIKAAIEKAGSSQSDIARSIPAGKDKHITPGAVYLVVRGTTKSARIATEISRVTGLPVNKLWPGKYPEIEFLEKLADTKPAEIKAALKQAVPSSSHPTKRSPAKRRAA